MPVCVSHPVEGFTFILHPTKIMGKIIGGTAVTKDLLEKLYSGAPLLIVLDIHGTILSHEHEPLEGCEKDVQNALRSIELQRLPVVIVTDGYWHDEMEDALRKLFRPYNLVVAVMDPVVRYRMIKEFRCVNKTRGKQDAYRVLQKVTGGGDMVLADDLPVNVKTWNSMGAKAHEVFTSLKPSMVPSVFPQLGRVARELNRSEDQVMDAFERTRSRYDVKHCVVGDVVVNSLRAIKSEL